MHRSGTNRRPQCGVNISAVSRRFGSTRLPIAAIRWTLRLTVLSALLPIAARPMQAQTLTVLHNFSDENDGGYPGSPLTSDGAGNFYGTTVEGGLGAMSGPTPGAGTVFELSPNGSGGWNETLLYSFCEPYFMSTCPDGDGPTGPVVFDTAGNLYGTTCAGGAYGYEYGPGYGVVFKLSPVGTLWTETVLYNFSSLDGSCPQNGLIMDSAGNLYGTNSAGVFEVSPSGSGWTEQLVYAYGGPAALTIDAAGDIFVNGTRDIFELSPNGKGGWNPKWVQTFHNYDDFFSPLVLDQAGNLYGTRRRGGAKGYGAIYKLSPEKNGSWTKTILYSFQGGTDGRYPDGGLVFDAAGNLYGTTAESFGGGYHRQFYGYGNVFELVAGSDQLTVLWSFNGTDGDFPYGSLIRDTAGNLYGIGFEGGSGGYGIAFEVTP